ncbi:hypothetical protein ILYODFUR_019330, partial [Ilyodon furcidens]
VVELISSAIGDLVQGIYYENSYSAEDGLGEGVDVTSWEDQTFLSHGALLAKSCQAAMQLAKHDREAQRLAYLYGKHLSLGHKLNSDLQPFVKTRLAEMTSFSLSAAPVVFHRQIVGKEKWHQHLQEARTLRNQLDYTKVRWHFQLTVLFFNFTFSPLCYVVLNLSGRPQTTRMPFQ